MFTRCSHMTGFDVNALLPCKLFFECSADYRAPLLVLSAAHADSVSEPTLMKLLKHTADHNVADSFGCTLKHLQVPFAVWSCFSPRDLSCRCVTPFVLAKFSVCVACSISSCSPRTPRPSPRSLSISARSCSSRRVRVHSYTAARFWPTRAFSSRAKRRRTRSTHCCWSGKQMRACAAQMASRRLIIRFEHCV